MTITDSDKHQFLETVWEQYRKYGRRDLPWRAPELDGHFDPYKILVSELMLQQTQVTRVIPKFTDFITRFPSTGALSMAPLGEVLRAWQGLGYNRRAKFLHLAAHWVQDQSGFPQTLERLTELPGVGVNTAGAILAYAYNQPAIFVETNIRTVYFYHFFQDVEQVSDAAIGGLLEQTIDHENPREFYWALMDYGAQLKTEVRNVAQSRHYTRQSTFSGSRRQIRGRVLRELASRDITATGLAKLIDDPRLAGVLDDLVAETLIVRCGSVYTLD